MTLEQRIAAEEAWQDLRTGNNDRAAKAFAKLGPGSPVSHLGRGFFALQAAGPPGRGARLQGGAGAQSRPRPGPRRVGPGRPGPGRRGSGLFPIPGDPEAGSRTTPGQSPGSKPCGKRGPRNSRPRPRRAFEAGDTEAGKEGLSQGPLLFSGIRRGQPQPRQDLQEGEERPRAPSSITRPRAPAHPKNKAILKEYAEALYEAEQYGRSLDVYERLAEAGPEGQGRPGAHRGPEEQARDL